MDSVGTYELKTHLSDILSRVEGGEHIIVTRNGTPVAKLVPSDEGRLSAEEAVARMRVFNRGIRLRGLSIRKMREEGRR